MIITGGNRVITQINLRDQGKYLLSVLDNGEEKYLVDKDNNFLYSDPPNKIVAIYKGLNLIWLTTYQLNIRSCYGSGVWLDNYNWIDNDQWKDS